jgi:hypothetical protein
MEARTILPGRGTVLESRSYRMISILVFWDTNSENTRFASLPREPDEEVSSLYKLALDSDL